MRLVTVALTVLLFSSCATSTKSARQYFNWPLEEYIVTPNSILLKMETTEVVDSFKITSMFPKVWLPSSNDTMPIPFFSLENSEVQGRYVYGICYFPVEDTLSVHLISVHLMNDTRIFHKCIFTSRFPIGKFFFIFRNPDVPSGIYKLSFTYNRTRYDYDIVIF